MRVGVRVRVAVEAAVEVDVAVSVVDASGAAAPVFVPFAAANSLEAEVGAAAMAFDADSAVIRNMTTAIAAIASRYTCFSVLDITPPGF